MVRTSLFAAAVFCVVTVTTFGDDWPQILGPQRNGVSTERLADRWPDGQPATVWKRSVGQGFAGVAVADGQVVLFHRIDGEEVAESMSATDGTVQWVQKFPTRFRSGYSSDGGPRCVPVITGNRVVLFGAAGGLRCLDVKSGEIVWQRETHDDFSAPEGFFGAGSSPLVEGDRVIVNVGGREGAAVVGLALSNGKTLWKSIQDTASYSSPVAVTIDGERHVIVISRMQTSSIDPADGNVRFSFPFGQRGATVNGASPVVIKGHVLTTSSYGIGSVFARIGKRDAKEVWSNRTTLASQYATPVEHEGLLYAIDGRQDAGPGSASLVCFDPFKPELKWRRSGLDYGTIIRAGDKLLILTHSGRLSLVAADPEGYRELAQAQVLADSPRGYRLPALSNGHLFVRDDGTLKCLRLP